MTKRYRKQNDQTEHEKLSRSTASANYGKSRTVQSERDNCDLNILVKRFGVGPVTMSAMQSEAPFGYYDSEIDLQSAHALVKRANENFMRLPAEVREEFRNDPSALLAAIQNSEHDPSWRERLETLGIFEKRAAKSDGGSTVPPERSNDES